MTFREWLSPKRSFVLCNSFISSKDVSKGQTCKAVYAKVMLYFKEEQQKAAAKPEAPRADVNLTSQGAPKVGNDKAPQARPGPTLWKCILQHGLEIRARATFSRVDCQGKVYHGQVFEVVEERAFYKGHGYFLRLSQNRGWLFSSSDRLGTCCVRAGPDEQPTSHVEGGGFSQKQRSGEGHSWWNGVQWDKECWKTPESDEAQTSWSHSNWKADDESWQSEKGQSAWSNARPSEWWEQSSASTHSWQWNQRGNQW